MGAAEKGEVFCQPIRGWEGRRIYFSLMHKLSLMFQMDFTVQLHRDSEDQNHQKWGRTGHLVAALGHLILTVGYSGFSYALDFQIRAFVCTRSCFLLFCVLQHRAGCSQRWLCSRAFTGPRLLCWGPTIFRGYRKIFVGSNSEPQNTNFWFLA